MNMTMPCRRHATEAAADPHPRPLCPRRRPRIARRAEERAHLARIAARRGAAGRDDDDGDA